MSAPTYKLSLIEWIDAHGVEQDWREIEVPGPRPAGQHVYSVGWITGESDDAVRITPHVCPKNDQADIPEQGCGDMTIPRPAIVRIWPLPLPHELSITSMAS